MGRRSAGETSLSLQPREHLERLVAFTEDGSHQPQRHGALHRGEEMRRGFVRSARGFENARSYKLGRDQRRAATTATRSRPHRREGIQGRVVKMTEEGADAHIDKMAKKYLNKDKYPYRAPGEKRVLVAIEPSKIHAIA